MKYQHILKVVVTDLTLTNSIDELAERRSRTRTRDATGIDLGPRSKMEGESCSKSPGLFDETDEVLQRFGDLAVSLEQVQFFQNLAFEELSGLGISVPYARPRVLVALVEDDDQLLFWYVIEENHKGEPVILGLRLAFTSDELLTLAKNLATTAAQTSFEDLNDFRLRKIYEKEADKTVGKGWLWVYRLRRWLNLA